MRKLLIALTAAVSTLVFQSGALAASGGYTLFGDGTLVSPGNNSNTAAQTQSVGFTSFGGVDFGAPTGMTFSQLTNLATDYKITAGDCGGGSPRFVVNVSSGSTTGNISLYIGPPKNYTGCPANTWTNSGNLATGANFIDTSQLPGGNFYDTYSNAETNYGTFTVNDIALVTDGGWAVGGTQTVLFDNSQINTSTITYEPLTKDSCKNGGWQQITSSPGPFKNQGDCVSYFATGGKNK